MRFKTSAHLVGLTMATTVLAQSSGDIAYFHLNRVKPSMTAQYKAARKRHWVWHQKMQGTWAYQVWQIVSGEASGTYICAASGIAGRKSMRAINESGAKKKIAPP